MTQDVCTKRPEFAQEQEDRQYWDMMLPGSHWLPTCANSECLPSIRELGKRTAMKQLNRLAGTAPPAAALLKTHLQCPCKTLKPGLITCHGSSGAIPGSCPQASTGPGRDGTCGRPRTQRHRATFSQERLHCPLSNER